MLGFMVGCAFLSMWLSNTSTVAMVMPIAEAVMQQVMSAEGQVSSQQDSQEPALKGICNPALQLEEGQSYKSLTKTYIKQPIVIYFKSYILFDFIDAEKQCEKAKNENRWPLWTLLFLLQVTYLLVYLFYQRS